MSGNFYKKILIAFFIIVLSVIPSLSESAGDNCTGTGVIVKNLSTIDLWYKQNNGACFKWNKSKIFTIKPGDSVEIFSDMICKTPYCNNISAYQDYKSYDRNGSCGVRILPGCNISDM
jgi:hypothetical protein